MKKLIVLGICICIMSVLLISMKYKRQASQILFTDLIESSFRNGNAEQLKSFLSDELELVIDSEKVNFNKISKDHAGFILTSFFKKNPPVKFAYVYQGQTPEKLKYSVGNYQTTNKEFMIYMLLSESKKGDPLIKKLQFREN